MIQLVWEFIVRPDDIREFETHYSSGGTWAELFRKSAGYRGTVLWRDATARVSLPGRGFVGERRGARRDEDEVLPRIRGA